MENAIGILIRIALSLLTALSKYGHSNLNTESSLFSLVSLAKAGQFYLLKEPVLSLTALLYGLLVSLSALIIVAPSFY